MRHGHLLLLSLLISALGASRPHILLYVVDDLGWSDVGYRPGSQMRTPVIDELANSGIILERYYAQPMCSPSRAALLTGRYPFRTGMQHFTRVLNPASRAALPLEQPTLAELLKSEGYSTYLLGKWHQGYASWKNTPIGRGFDHFKGLFLGEGDYYDKTKELKTGTMNYSGFDWWENDQLVTNETGIHNKDLYDQQFLKWMSEYDSSNPMFMFYSQQLVHLPLESKPEWEEKCLHIQDRNRRIFCGMGYGADDGLRLVIDTLKSKGMWDDTLLIVTSDNGGSVAWKHCSPASAAVNFPLRSGKGSLFEGGVRVIGFINGGKNVLPDSARGTRNNQLLHLVDWLPTLVKLANPLAQLPHNLDGLNIWDSIISGSIVPRKTLPVNINVDVLDNTGGNNGWIVSIINEGWKLIVINATDTKHNYGWYPEPPSPNISPPLEEHPGWYLFHLDTDPYEHNNLFSHEPTRVETILAVLDEYMQDYTAPQYNEPIEAGLPTYHGGAWAPFDDYPTATQ